MISYNSCNDVIIVNDNKNYFIKKSDDYYKELSKNGEKNKKKNTIKNINSNKKNTNNIFNHIDLIDDFNQNNFNFLIENKKLFKKNYKYYKDDSLVKKISMMHKLI